MKSGIEQALILTYQFFSLVSADAAKFRVGIGDVEGTITNQ